MPVEPGPLSLAPPQINWEIDLASGIDPLLSAVVCERWVPLVRRVYETSGMGVPELERVLEASAGFYVLKGGDERLASEVARLVHARALAEVIEQTSSSGHRISELDDLEQQFRRRRLEQH